MTKALPLVLTAILAVSPALADARPPPVGERWRPSSTVEVLDRVTLRIHWHESLAALREAAASNGVATGDLQGFATLRRNTVTGEYVCDVFVVKMTGAGVDAARTLTFGHEVLHCLGLSHQ